MKRMTAGALLVALVLLALVPLAAHGLAATQDPAPPAPAMPGAPAAQASEETGAATIAPAPPAEDTGPVPVPEPSEKALRYYKSGNNLYLVETLWGFLVPAVILFTGFSARLRTVAARIARDRRFLTIVVFMMLFTLVTFVIDLPLSYCTGFARPHAYGLSDQAGSKWWADTFKELALTLVLGSLAMTIPYGLLRRSPKRWWLYTTMVAVPLVVFFQMITPVFIDPMFNTFGPMKDKALETRILDLASRAGIEGGRVFEVEKSVDTKMVNAYVNGFGATKQIVLWDTTLAKLKPEEVLFVMGHEMGHFVLGHVRQLVLLSSLLILAGLYAVHRTATFLIARFRHRFGFDELSDVASVPLFALIFSAVAFVAMPALFAFSRHIEHEADRFGLEITRDNRTAALAFVKLQQENLGMPRPGTLNKVFRQSHPPLGERIDFANEYRPWAKGEPLVYGELFRGK